jgi:hypothetical protein
MELEAEVQWKDYGDGAKLGVKATRQHSLLLLSGKKKNIRAVTSVRSGEIMMCHE